MSQEKRVSLELTEPELRRLLSVCAKELIPQLYHDAIDPELLSLLNKGTAALAPKAEIDAKEQTPA